MSDVDYQYIQVSAYEILERPNGGHHQLDDTYQVLKKGRPAGTLLVYPII
ncbi:unnamed protein product [Arabidopsis thaliana]|uniref:Uncharacterized protein n=1 Tax=Arabidopsis thaliana TaxID=3702 RepID=Q9FFL8_ARATH|nr:unnamed protein product [Arabidopsis thaliana]